MTSLPPNLPPDLPPSTLTASPAIATGTLHRRWSSGRNLFESAMTLLSGTFLAIVIAPLFAVLFYVIVQGAARFDSKLFTDLPPGAMMPGGGIANAILGTIIVVLLGAVLALPFGILAAVYLSEFSSGPVARWVRFSTNVLSGVPSIVTGIFAYGLLVVTTGGFSAFAGGVALAVLMLPTIVRTTDEALQIVPSDLRWASTGLGASNYQTVLKVVLPAALPTIVTGALLAIARAAGETAPLIFTALNSPFWPSGLWKPTPSLAVLVYNFATVPFKNQQQLAWAGSLILVCMVLVTSLLARWATNSKKTR